jgi:hypothetical protein
LRDDQYLAFYSQQLLQRENENIQLKDQLASARSNNIAMQTALQSPPRFMPQENSMSQNLRAMHRAFVHGQQTQTCHFSSEQEDAGTNDVPKKSQFLAVIVYASDFYWGGGNSTNICAMSNYQKNKLCFLQF